MTMKTARWGLCGLLLGLVSAANPASAAEPAFTCPTENGNFAHPRDGTKYLECIRGKPIEKACTPGLVWDDLRKGCASPGAVRHKPPKKPPAKKKPKKR
jgi:hypothetical protein